MQGPLAALAQVIEIHVYPQLKGVGGQNNDGGCGSTTAVATATDAAGGAETMVVASRATKICKPIGFRV